MQRTIMSIFFSVFVVMQLLTKSYAAENGIIITEDKHHISYVHYAKGNNTVIILAHGFYNNKDVYIFKKLAEMFSEKYDVISFDFRGHGKSDGLFSWTAYEEKDLRAIVNYAKEKGYKKVGVVGFSLGAAISLIEASNNRDIDAVISVSAPYDFWKINYNFFTKEMLEDLKLNLGPKGKGKGIRPGNPFIPKIKPIDIVWKISPTPVLFIHGDKDWLINSSHSDKLFEAAKEPKKKIIIKDGGHAERLYYKYPEEFKDICFNWFDECQL